jgi:hypothetical protein
VNEAPPVALTNGKKPRTTGKQAAERTIDAHFAATHREPEKAAARRV